MFQPETEQQVNWSAAVVKTPGNRSKLKLLQFRFTEETDRWRFRHTGSLETGIYSTLWLSPSRCLLAFNNLSVRLETCWILCISSAITWERDRQVRQLGQTGWNVPETQVRFFCINTFWHQTSQTLVKTRLSLSVSPWRGQRRVTWSSETGVCRGWAGIRAAAGGWRTTVWTEPPSAAGSTHTAENTHEVIKVSHWVITQVCMGSDRCVYLLQDASQSVEQDFEQVTFKELLPLTWEGSGSRKSDRPIPGHRQSLTLGHLEEEIRWELQPHQLNTGQQTWIWTSVLGLIPTVLCQCESGQVHGNNKNKCVCVLTRVWASWTYDSYPPSCSSWADRTSTGTKHRKLQTQSQRPNELLLPLVTCQTKHRSH